MACREAGLGQDWDPCLDVRGAALLSLPETEVADVAGAGNPETSGLAMRIAFRAMRLDEAVGGVHPRERNRCWKRGWGHSDLEVGEMRKPARDARKWLVTEQETQKYCTEASRK